MRRITIHFGPKRHPQPNRSPQFVDEHGHVLSLCEISDNHLWNLQRYVMGYGKRPCPTSLRDWGHRRVYNEMRRRGFSLQDRLPPHPNAQYHQRFFDDQSEEFMSWMFDDEIWPGPGE